jgi:tetratricopeptide (TPR) repeat protein
VKRLFFVVFCGCSGAPLPSDFKLAQEREAARDDQGALAAYHAIREDCERTGKSRPQDDCSLAAVREAEMLERLERWPAAYQAWLAAARLSVPQRVTTGRELRDRQKSRALVRAAELAHQRLADDAGARKLAWQVVEEYPQEVPADDALKLAVSLEGNSSALQQKLATLWERDKDLDLGDNLLFARAQLTGSVELYDQLAEVYPHSSLRDDSLWRAAEILRKQGDFRGAILRLQKILDTHKDALITGSYNSLVLDDAQLLVGRIWLDDLHQPDPAANAFQNLADDFKDSVLRDDALYELARAKMARDKKSDACAALARLFREYPNGNMVRRGRELASTIGCQ